ncbi:hypothetical protein Sjap_010928 [Stephania japonica]|uniref:Uncharacterized protein n=1 Tax=Stephania japonica TaxID=461633 RepID=A0AAP0JCE0_9MAGN
MMAICWSLRHIRNSIVSNKQRSSTGIIVQGVGCLNQWQQERNQVRRAALNLERRRSATTSELVARSCRTCSSYFFLYYAYIRLLLGLCFGAKVSYPTFDFHFVYMIVVYYILIL